MSDVKRLLAEATPLPWDWDPTLALVSSRVAILDAAAWSIPPLPPDAALIVYAVNRLPDYEAAVEALEGLLRLIGAQDHEWQETTDARAALARLRESVPA